jgi:putative transposase
MARLPRLTIAGLPHLIEQAAHGGRSLFSDDADRQAYRALLGASASAAGVALHAYALEPVRVVLLATPSEGDSLSRMMQNLGRGYTSWFNRRHGGRGTLWAGRFRATVIDPQTELVAAMRHVEADAVLLPGSQADASCSLAHHLGRAHDALVSDHSGFWALGNTPFDRHAAYRNVVLQPLAAEERRRFDDALRKGWPLGPADFVLALEQRSKRRLRPSRPGRPKLKKADWNDSVPN